ncbi:hypothetical protein G6F62_015541 [Rhizopus arrhizus]|nr:hypothetical protein G6F62_015541 [Rhizopus arrhizus]KAG1383645.1 hypothetical protein G6F59_017781 [Rhizopus arrhizus]
MVAGRHRGGPDELAQHHRHPAAAEAGAGGIARLRTASACRYGSAVQSKAVGRAQHPCVGGLTGSRSDPSPGRGR